MDETRGQKKRAQHNGGEGGEAGRGVLPAPVFLVLSLPCLVTIYLGAPSSLFGEEGGKEKKIFFL